MRMPALLRRLGQRWRRTAHAGNPDATFVPFSLFQGDLVNRLFAFIGIGGRRAGDLALRCVVLIGITWVPMALLAASAGLVSLQITSRNFFADFAAYAQFLVGLPLFVLAEAVIARSTRDAAHQFLGTEIVRPADHSSVMRTHRQIAALRQSFASDSICLAIAAILSWAIYSAELTFPATTQTWHTDLIEGQAGRTLTGAGAWEFFIALPLQMYWWLRVIWKIGLWYLYLRRVSALRLDLRASHPDRTGGIGFVSTVQARFSLVILAYGISNVAATVGYKVAVEGASLDLPPVWGPIIGFAIGAPLLFTLPLLLFTRQLRQAKERAMRRYRDMAMDQVRATEELLARRESRERTSDLRSAFVEAGGVWKMFEQTQAMRVVPFDLRSVAQLIGSTMGSLATLLPLLNMGGTLPKWLEFVARFFQTMTGKG
jgi:hypothetical protein